MSQIDKLKLMLINEAIELQTQLNIVKQTQLRNQRAIARSLSIINDEYYPASTNPSGTGKMYMLKYKKNDDIHGIHSIHGIHNNDKIGKKPYSRSRKQLNPTRGICSKAESNLVITMPNFSKAIDRNAPDTDYLLPLYNTSPLLEMTTDEVAEAIRFCEQEISQEKLEQSIMYVLPDINIKEARHFLANVDWMNF